MLRMWKLGFVMTAALACAPAKNRGSGSARSSGDAPPPDFAPLLEAHNQLRDDHCAPPLSWSAELADVAQSWADKLGKSGCGLEHNNTSYGENIAAGTAPFGPEDAARIWYREIDHYAFGGSGFSMRTGHFTQLVWVGSERMGCGKTSCKGLELWVCNYDPPGNVKGRYEENVLPTSCK